MAVIHRMKFSQKVVVIHPKGRRYFLALKRSADDESRPGDWDLPGGNLDIGEDHEDAISREVHEESGLEIGDTEPVEVFSGYDKEGDFSMIKIGYVAMAVTTEVKISDEHTEFAWMTYEEFNEKCSADYLKEIVRKVYQG